MPIEVFKTNVRRRKQASSLLRLLHDQLEAAEINFDLEDCDRVLRVKAEQVCQHQIMQLLRSKGFYCSPLD